MAMERVAVSYRLDARIVRRMRAYVEAHGGSMTAIVERGAVMYMDAGELEHVSRMFDVMVRELGPERVEEILEDALVIHGTGGGVSI